MMSHTREDQKHSQHAAAWPSGRTHLGQKRLASRRAQQELYSGASCGFGLAEPAGRGALGLSAAALAGVGTHRVTAAQE